jgi:hypothetical protein
MGSLPPSSSCYSGRISDLVFDVAYFAEFPIHPFPPFEHGRDVDGQRLLAMLLRLVSSGSPRQICVRGLLAGRFHLYVQVK